MKKKLLICSIIIVIALALAGLIYASTKLKGNEIKENSYLVELTFDELQQKVDNKDSFILVITQTNCAHCAEYKPVLKKVLAKHEITAYEIAQDKLDSEKKAKLNIIANTSGTPNTVFIVDGEEVNTSSRLVGNQPANKIESRLKAMGYIK